LWREAAIKTEYGEGIRADGVFCGRSIMPASSKTQKIDRLMSIVAETEQTPNRRNCPLKSRAEFSDGSAGRFSGERRKIFGENSARYDA
jgi:hypothetical protein